MTFYAVSHYRNHINTSKICHSFNPYCCKFCEYIGFDSNGLNQHLIKIYVCSYHYEELKVTTGLLPNIGKEVNVKKKFNNNISSYTYSRCSADGMEDEVQLNLHDDTVDKQHELRKSDSYHSMKGNDLIAIY